MHNKEENLELYLLKPFQTKALTDVDDKDSWEKLRQVTSWSLVLIFCDCAILMDYWSSSMIFA